MSNPISINDFDPKWISEEITRDCIHYAKTLGENLARMGMTNTQIRNFFGEVKKIQSQGMEAARVEFLLLQPKLAYTVKRFERKPGHEGLMEFQRVLDRAHEAVNTASPDKGKKQFENFVDFLEAILAFHRAASSERF